MTSTPVGTGTAAVAARVVRGAPASHRSAASAASRATNATILATCVAVRLGRTVAKSGKGVGTRL